MGTSGKQIIGDTVFIVDPVKLAETGVKTFKTAKQATAAITNLLPLKAQIRLGGS